MSKEILLAFGFGVTLAGLIFSWCYFNLIKKHQAIILDKLTVNKILKEHFKKNESKI